MTQKRSMVPAVLGLTALFEGITALVRFGFDLQATRDTRDWVAPLSGGIRIHHAYIGVVVAVLGFLIWRMRPAVGRWVLVVGAALVASDLIHHFVVLWCVVGDPEFHLVYPLGP